MPGSFRLDDDDLLELTQRTDELGVLSVYADTDPRGTSHRKGTAIDLQNRFRQLLERLTQTEDSKRGRAIVTALERVRPQVEELTDAAATGRSRIAFFGLAGDWSVQFDSILPVANRVVFDDGPFVHPLLELLDEGRPAGVIVGSAEEFRVFEWRLGSARLLSRMERQYLQAPHERAGQLGGGPDGQFNTPVREQRQARDRDRTERFLDAAVQMAAGLVDERGWERILVSGGAQWTEPIVSRFPAALRDMVYTDARVLNGLDDVALTATVTEWAHEQHTRREQHVLQRLRGATGSNRAAFGVSEVSTALNAGRVSHLVYDPHIRYVGTIGADAALYSADEVGPGSTPRKPEPRFTERLVERALHTGARISPIEGAGDADLSDADGIAAFLRW